MEQKSIMAVNMDNISTIRDLVNLWPTRAKLADDIEAVTPALKVSVHQVHKWAEKGSIPSKYHKSLLAAARRRNFAISAEMIVNLHSPERGAA